MQCQGEKVAVVDSSGRGRGGCPPDTDTISVLSACLKNILIIAGQLFIICYF